MRRVLLLWCLMLVSATAATQVVDRRPLQFTTSAEEVRFRALADELRCVMCQNQTLADSDAQIAVDLRREILELIRRGHSDAEIREFLVARYGEFVLYRPRVGPATWLLWFGPLLVLSAGGWVVWRLARRQRSCPARSLPPGEDW